MNPAVANHSPFAATPDGTKRRSVQDHHADPTPQSVIEEFRKLASNEKAKSSSPSMTTTKNNGGNENKLVSNKATERFRDLIGSMEDDPDAIAENSERLVGERKSNSRSHHRRKSSSRKKKKHKHKSSSSSNKLNKSSSSGREQRREERLARRKQRKKEQELRNATSADKSSSAEKSAKSWGIKSVVSEHMDNWEHFEASDAEFSASNHDDSHCTAPTSNVDQNLLALSLLEKSTEDALDVEKVDIIPFDNMLVVQGTSSRRLSASSAKQSKRRTSNDPSQTSSGMATPSVIARGVQQVADNLDVDVDVDTLQYSAQQSSQQQPSPRGGSRGSQQSPGESPTGSRDWSRHSKNNNEFDDDDSQELRRKAAKLALRRAKIQRRKRSFAGSKQSFSGMELDADEDGDTMSTLSYDPVLDFLAAANATKEGGDAADNVDTGLGGVEKAPIEFTEEEKQRVLAEAVKVAMASKLVIKDQIKSSKSLADVLEGSREGENTEDEASPATTRGSSSQALSVLSSTRSTQNSSSTPREAPSVRSIRSAQNSSATPLETRSVKSTRSTQNSFSTQRTDMLSTQDLVGAAISVDGSKTTATGIGDEELGNASVTHASVYSQKNKQHTDGFITPPSYTPAVPDSGAMTPESTDAKRLQKRKFIGYAVFGTFLIASIITIIVLATSREGGGGDQVDRGIADPAPSPTFVVSDAQEMLEKVLISNNHLDATTPQGKAFNWILNEEQGFSLSSESQIIQRFALGTLFFALGGENWLNRDRWMSSNDECTWFSSHTEAPCDDRGEFVHLRLRSNNLHGVLPPELSLLSNIQTIELPDNSLFGAIPESLKDLAALSMLNLNSNDYKGPLPDYVGQFTTLKVLSLDLNRFTGTLPTSLGKMTRLEVLSLAANQFSSILPADLSEMIELRELNLEHNKLTGPIRTELGLLRNLESLLLDINFFSDSIPPEVGLLANLKSFSCNSCTLVGQLPSEFGLLRRLEILEVETNGLTGTLPSEIGAAVSLKRLGLSANDMVGTLPTTLGNLLDIQLLDLSTNRFTGTIPVQLSLLSSHGFALLLHSNSLTGSVPSDICTALSDHSGYMSLDDQEVAFCACSSCHGTGPKA